MRLRNANRTRDNTRRDFGFDTNLARRALNSEHIAVSDTARRGVGRIDPQLLARNLLKLRNESVGAVHAALVMEASAIQRILIGRRAITLEAGVNTGMGLICSSSASSHVSFRLASASE